VLEQAIAAAEPVTDMTTEMRQLLAILRDVSDRLAALEQRMSEAPAACTVPKTYEGEPGGAHQ
jgi:hypothetical protein